MEAYYYKESDFFKYKKEVKKLFDNYTITSEMASSKKAFKKVRSEHCFPAAWDIIKFVDNNLYIGVTIFVNSKDVKSKYTVIKDIDKFTPFMIIATDCFGINRLGEVKLLIPINVPVDYYKLFDAFFTVVCKVHKNDI